MTKNNNERLVEEAFKEVTADKSKNFETKKAIEAEMAEYIRGKHEDAKLIQIGEYVHEQVAKQDYNMKKAYKKVTDDKSRIFHTQKAIQDEMVEYMDRRNEEYKLSRIQAYVKEQVRQHDAAKKK